jgi:lipid-binding SYLF domain-containing protein
MSAISKLAGLAAVALTALPLSAAVAETDQEAVIDGARVTIQDLRHDAEFGNARQLLHQARAILIVPKMYKAGFFFGGEGGRGVLLYHAASGRWSSPAFYNIGSASFGLQIGLEQSELVLFVMSQRALTALMQDQFKIGVGAGFAVVSLGSNVEGAANPGGVDLVSWASSSGAYAGISLDGSIIAPAHDDDTAFYGRPVSSSQILYQMPDRDPVGVSLQQTLASVR